MKSPIFKIGDIVALKSHPYSKDYTSIIISGEQQLLSPLLTIIEILISFKKKVLDEKEDKIIKIQYKCIWYSNKNFGFEEIWLDECLLKLISTDSKKLVKEDLISSVGSKDYLLVSLKTLPLELGKQKSSFSLTEFSEENSSNSNTTITSLLNFVSPILHIIDIVNKDDFDNKNNFIDKVSGIQKRYISEWFIKCKWFNPGSSKMSEKFIPIDALSIISNIDDKILIGIKNVIEENKFFKIIQIDEKTKTLIRPISSLHRNGKFLLKGYDYIKNNIVEFDIEKVKLEIVENYFIKEAPSFDYIKEGGSMKSISKEYIEILKEASEKKMFIRVKYKNINDKISQRTLKDFSTSIVKGEEDKDINYLIGFCLLRKANRTFRLDNIQKLEVLDLEVSEY